MGNSNNKSYMYNNSDKSPRSHKRDKRRKRHKRYKGELNVYGEPLQPCKEKNHKDGSWDPKGFCSEKDRGVHTICIKNISKNATEFSLKTGQSDWSDNRGDNNHCVCLGAWSLYSAKENKENKENTENKKVLKCDAIPKFIFEPGYYKHWNTWNGKQKPNQIENGLDNLYEICKIDADGNEKKLNNLDRNYERLKETIKKEKKRRNNNL